MVPADSLLTVLHSIRDTRLDPLSQGMLVPDRLSHSRAATEALLPAKDLINQ